MAQNDRFAGPVNDAWLAQHIEPALAPDQPIVDPHHHLWARDSNTYLLPELLADLASGHNVRATVYEECRSMYRADGPEEERSIGETELTQRAPVIRLATTGKRHLDVLKWALVPYFTKDLKKVRRPINARCETVATSGMFKTAFAKRRCLVPAPVY